MADFIRVSVGRPKTAEGGDIAVQISTKATQARTFLNDLTQTELEFVRRELEAIWPRGPERGRPHSQDLWKVVNTPNGARLENTAFYLTFIHRKGAKSRIVYNEEVVPRLEDLVEVLEESGRAILEDILSG